MSQISRKSFGDGETISVHCSKLPFLLSNGQNDAACHGFVITRAKKEAPATTTSALILHQLFEQILYIPLIVFNFLHQPTDAVRPIPLLQELGERPIECGQPTLDHAAVLLHGICYLADGQPLGKALPEKIGVVVEHRFERLLGKRKILAHGLICLAVGYTDVLLPFPDEFVSPQIHPVVFADVLGVFIAGSAATDGALHVLVINISEWLAFGLRKAVLIHFADGAFVDLAPGLADVFIPQHTIDFDLLAEGGVPDEVVMLVVFFGKAGILADHDGLAGVDVLEHPDNEDGLSVVSLVKPDKYPFKCHKEALLPPIFLQYSTDFGGEKERRWDGENWDLRE